MVEKMPPSPILYNQILQLQSSKTHKRLKMSRGLTFLHISIKPPILLSSSYSSNFHPKMPMKRPLLDLQTLPISRLNKTRHRKSVSLIITAAAGVPLPPLDLTEDNVRQVLVDARDEFSHLFDTSIGMTGQVEFAELDGPFVKISLKGRFWHERSLVLARLGNYLKQRIPEILEVDIEDEKQLDDSPENF